MGRHRKSNVIRDSAGRIRGERPEDVMAVALAARAKRMGNLGSPGAVPFSYRSGPHWFVVRSNIQSEFRAQMGLEAKGMRTFLPRLTKWVSHARRKVVVKRPLIRGYFFVELDPARQSFEDVRQTDGIELLIANQGIPSVVPTGFIEEFIRREMLGEFDETAGSPLPDRATVKIVGGEWDEFFGVVIGNRARNGELLVKLIGNRRAVKVSHFSVRPAIGGLTAASEYVQTRASIPAGHRTRREVYAPGGSTRAPGFRVSEPT